MKKNFVKSLFAVIGITLILLIFIVKRIYLKSFNADSLLTFFSGFALFFVFYLILKTVLNAKNRKK
jgi:hypothetical protein